MSISNILTVALTAAPPTTPPAAPSAPVITTTQAVQYLIAFGLLLFFTRPLKGLLMEPFKVMLRLALVGLGLQVLSISVIRSWANSSASWAHVPTVYVPVVALILLVGMSLSQIMFISGKTIEKVLKLIFFVVGGSFTAGSASWIALENDVWSTIASGLGIVIDVVKIITDIVHP